MTLRPTFSTSSPTWPKQAELKPPCAFSSAKTFLDTGPVFFELRALLQPNECQLAS
jgi:hypothetical protein